MIIAKAPLRVTLAGGGTDLPKYYSEFGGFVISAAINKYVYVCANRSDFIDGYHLRYSRTEETKAARDIDHPILREALTKIEPGIEIAVLADVPAGTGLGSSGAFTVALLAALHPDMPTRWLAEEACALEIDRLGRTVGEQDAYIAAYGGVRAFTWHTSGAVAQDPIDVGPLAQRLVLFYTGTTRNAADVLNGQADATYNLHETKRVGLAQAEALFDGNLDLYGRLLHEHWLIKRERAFGVTTDRIDDLYQRGLDAGALGGKLVGAGGGGFLLFYAQDTDRLRAAFDLRELRFGWDRDGCTRS